MMDAGTSSFVQIPSEILIDPEISALDLRIYCVLMDFGRRGRGFSQIGHKYLGRLVRKHPKTIAKSINRLAELGYISVERIGLNRNDRIRCQKTVHRQKSDGAPTIPQGSNPTLPSSIRDRSTKKRYKVPHNSLPLNTLPATTPKPSEALPNALRSSIDLEAIKRHRPITDRLSERLYMVLRPASVASWFNDMAVIDDDDTAMTISVGHKQVDWVEEHYSKLLNRAAEKKVLIVA